MRSIIEKIYDYMLESEEGYFKKYHISEEEGKAYDTIRNSLTDSQKEIFDKFEELYSDRHCESEQEAFFVGFRTGAKLVMEIMNLHE